jgi:hypothetical protein
VFLQILALSGTMVNDKVLNRDSIWTSSAEIYLRYNGPRVDATTYIIVMEGKVDFHQVVRGVILHKVE